ncbi:MAG: hypothetical protein JOZ48_10375, partial [Acidobacteriaceae bacterium]|nr:hypothetical protein [Acidobacteriaceae bacterium]
MNRRSIITLLICSCSATLYSYAAPDPPKLRLPDAVRPLRYSADLRMVPGEDHFTGMLEIELDIRQPVSTVWLHGKSLVFREASIRAEDTDQTASIEPAANDFVAVSVSKNLAQGHALLRISYA